MKAIVTIKSGAVAPRFDLATEVLIAEGDAQGIKTRNVLMPGPSADELCSLVIKEDADIVICGGIEESFFQYLEWKKVRVLDRVIGPADAALRLAIGDKLKPGMILDGGSDEIQ